MKKQQLKTLVTKLSKELFLTLKLIEDRDSVSDPNFYWLTYKVLNEDLLVTITATCGVLRVAGQCVGTLTLLKIAELDAQINKVIKVK